MKTTEDAMMNRLCFTVQYGLMVVFCLQVAGCETVDPPIQYSGMHPTDWPRKDFYFSPGDSLYMEVAQIDPVIAEVRFYFNDTLVASSLPQDGFASAIAVLPNNFEHAYAIGLTEKGTEFGRLHYRVKFNTAPKIAAVLMTILSCCQHSLYQVFPFRSGLPRSEIIRAPNMDFVEHPAYSPDGHYLAYSYLDRNRGRWDIRVSTFDGRQVYHLTDHISSWFRWVNGGIAWLSDGSGIVFAARNEGCSYGIYMIDWQPNSSAGNVDSRSILADDTCSYNITKPVGDPASPRHVLASITPVQNGRSGHHIARVDIETGAVERIMEGRFSIGDVSPDGRYFTLFGDLFDIGENTRLHSGAIYDRISETFQYPSAGLGDAGGFLSGEHRALFRAGTGAATQYVVAIYDPVNSRVDYYDTGDRRLTSLPRAKPRR